MEGHYQCGSHVTSPPNLKNNMYFREITNLFLSLAYSTFNMDIITLGRVHYCVKSIVYKYYFRNDVITCKITQNMWLIN